MPTTLRFACDLRHGLHARPASLLAQVAAGSKSKIIVRKGEGDGEADALGVLSVIALDIQPGDEWSVAVEGADEDDVASQIDALVRSHFGESESGEAIEVETVVRVPAALKRLGVQFLRGRSLSPGNGYGRVVVIGGWSLCEGVPDRTAGSVEFEQARARQAIEAVSKEFLLRAGRTSGPGAEMLRAHGAMVKDSQFVDAIGRRISTGATAERAIAEATDEFTQRLRSLTSLIIRERAADVMDLGSQLLEELGGKSLAKVPELTGQSVVFAEMLTPGQLLKLDHTKLAGLVLGEVGATSHVVILARSMGIPVLAGVADPRTKATGIQNAFLEDSAEIVLIDPPASVLRLYEFDDRAAAKRRSRLAPLVASRGVSRDGVEIEIAANASSEADVKKAIANDADGIGLFRTEFLYLDRDRAPSESELFEAYRGAVKAAAGRMIVFRTFDIGADKPAPFLHMPAEENPFLGERGIRLYKKHATLLGTQVRAIVRAAEGTPKGSVRIMAPMVTVPEEMQWFRTQVRAAETNLRNGGHQGPELEVGMMLEVPAAASSIARFVEHADFFSLGTNDLSQYWFAADRGNALVREVAREIDPSFLALLRGACSEAKKHGKWIGLCGEMGSGLQNLPLLLGIGLDEISVAAGVVAEMKMLLHRLDAADCRCLVESALGTGAEAGVGVGAKDASGVQSLLEAFRSHSGAVSPIDEELVDLQCSALTKEEAIRELIGVLFGADRTRRPRDLEEDIWSREETYSTGLGFGFAVPHCRSDAVDSVSVAIGRLRQDIDWGSSDGKPVRHIILLAVPNHADAKAHLQVLAKLARRLVHEEFRTAVERSPSPLELADLLKRELGL